MGGCGAAFSTIFRRHWSLDGRDFCTGAVAVDVRCRLPSCWCKMAHLHLARSHGEANGRRGVFRLGVNPEAFCFCALFPHRPRAVDHPSIDPVPHPTFTALRITHTNTTTATAQHTFHVARRLPPPSNHPFVCVCHIQLQSKSIHHTHIQESNGTSNIV